MKLYSLMPFLQIFIIFIYLLIELTKFYSQKEFSKMNKDLIKTNEDHIIMQHRVNEKCASLK